jgi:hypothetical protein
MDSRGRVMVPLAYANILSSATSTVSLASVDLGPYFNVGKREVKFVVALTSLSTLTTYANVTILEGTAASTASSTSSLFTTVLGADGSSATWTSTADTNALFEWHGVVTKRYLTVRYNGTTSTGSTWGVMVCALPQTRAS